MNDRTPQNPGRVLITPENGAAAYYATLTRADNPTQAGDPLNKATFLKDSTAALFEKDANAVPDDILREIWNTYRKKIGDTLTTARTDLGEKWLLCNGETSHTAEYPQLRSLLPNTGVKLMSGDIAGDMNDVAYGNGLFVAVGHTGSRPLVATATDPAGPWTFQTPVNADISLRAIDFDGTTWVAVGLHDGSDYGLALVSTDPTGSWTAVKVVDGNYSLNAIAHYNGTWVATRSQGGICYTQNPLGTWTYKAFSSNPYLYDIFCHNGTWIAVGNYTTTVNDVSLLLPRLWYTTDPSGTWSDIKFENVYGVDTPARRLIFAKNNLVLLCETGHIYYADSLTGTWKSTSVLANKMSELELTNVGDIAYINGKFVVSCGNTSTSKKRPYIMRASNLAGPWAAELVGEGKLYAARICAYGNYFVMATYPYGVGTTGLTPYIVTDALFHLPAVSQDKLYTYIKAKE